MKSWRLHSGQNQDLGIAIDGGRIVPIGERQPFTVYGQLLMLSVTTGLGAGAQVIIGNRSPIYIPRIGDVGPPDTRAHSTFTIGAREFGAFQIGSPDCDRFPGPNGVGLVIIGETVNEVYVPPASWFVAWNDGV